MTPDVAKGQLLKKADALFDNLVSLAEFQIFAARWLRKPDLIPRRTIYKWVRDGMPHEKIRGDLYFPPVEAAQWLKRT